MQKFTRLALMALAALGMILFAALFATTFADRAQVEKAAVFAVKAKVTAEVKTQYPALVDEPFLAGAEKLRDRFSQESDRWSAALDAKLDVAVATTIAALCGCETVSDDRQSAVTSFFNRRQGLAADLSSGLTNFIQGRYDATLNGLLRDIRIFSGVNVIAFALVFLLAWFKPSARFHLLVPAGLLLVSALLTICLYIFGQNWFYTLMLGNFWGFAYLAYMGIVFLLVADITLNECRVVSAIVNTLTSIPLTPC